MVELDADSEMTPAEAAAFLRRFADELEGGAGPDIGEEEPGTPRTMTLVVGDDSATVVLPDELELEVEIESRSPLLGSEVEQSIELEFSWDVDEIPEDDAIEVV